MAMRNRYPKRFLVRFTDNEYQELTERATDAGLSLSRYLVENALSEKLITAEDKERAEALFHERELAINELTRVGNNLNQIARQLNSQRGVITTEQLEMVLVELTSALKELYRVYSEPASK